jgi:hypothetical protein
MPQQEHVDDHPLPSLNNFINLVTRLQWLLNLMVHIWSHATFHKI